MNCQDARERWHQGLDEDCRDPGLQAHLDSCDACREYSEQILAIVGALEELREDTEHIVSARSDPARKVHAGFGRAHWSLLRRTVTGVAATITIVVGASLYLGTQRTSTPKGPEAVVSAPAVHAELGIALRGESAERYLAVPAKATQPDVQMYWLYPTLATVAVGNGS